VRQQLAESEITQEVPKAEAPKSFLLKFLSNPFIGLIGWAATVTSVLLTTYFYQASREYPQLTCYVHPVKATIVRTGEASRLITSFDNKPIASDITAAQVALWNRGNRPIKKQNVLKPVVIYTQDNSPILEATIRKTSRDVTHLSLNLNELQKGRVIIDWDILERNDGGIIQLIYAGKPDVHIQAEGVIEGQPSVELAEFSGIIKSPYEQYESERSEYRTIGFLLLGLGILLLWGALGIRKAKSDFKKSSDKYIILLKSFIEDRDKDIKWEIEQIELNDKFIVDVEKQSRRFEEEGLSELVESSSQRIAAYRKEQQSSRERIKTSESQKEELIAKINKEAKVRQKEERHFNWALVVILSIAMIACLLAFYFILIAQPIRPPFGF
jgi:hypothetical protein